MSKYFDLLLGILAAVGGFVDLGQLIFGVQIGAKFAYREMWVVALATLAIALFMEMSGRIAAVTQKPAFLVLRERLGDWLGGLTLVAAVIVNFLTCAAEIGGVAIILKLLTGGNWLLLGLVGGLGVLAILAVASFEMLEHTVGLLGVLMLVYVVAAVKLKPDWGALAAGFLPNSPQGAVSNTLFYWYTVVALFSAVLLPYEVYLYSSGAIEDKWTAGDLHINALTAVLGSVFGALLTIALIVVGAKIFLPLGIQPQLPGAAIYGPTQAIGKTAGLLALGGMLFAITGAAIETALSNGYALAQFFHWPWGKSKKLREVPKFTWSWVITVLAAMLVILLGIDPIKLVQYVIVISVVPLPLTYYGLMVAAQDKGLMGKHANGQIITVLGWALFGLVCIAAAAAIPLLIVTHGGQG
jgi:manganese transport protein